MIKLPKFIIKWDKGWFAALGLHHARVALIPLSVGLLFTYFGMEMIGTFIASWGAWWYASREYGNGPYPPETFEVMDFVSPFIVSTSFFLLKGSIEQ